MTTHTASTTLPFELGEPRSFRALTLVPLFPTAEPHLEYVGLDEGVASGLTVTEIGEAGVVELLALDNPLAKGGSRSWSTSQTKGQPA